MDNNAQLEVQKQKRLTQNGKSYSELAEKCEVSFIENDAPVNKSVNTNGLDRMYIDHSFEIKALRGLEEIAFHDDGVFTICPKSSNSPYSKLELRAYPDSCREFLANKGANYLYATVLGQTVYRLVKENKKAVSDFDGRIWIPTSTIIKEMTRTQYGTNQSAHRNESTRDKVMDTLLALSSSQLRGYDKKNQIVFSEYILRASYYRKIKDDCGNILKDVWGFPKDLSGLFARTEEHTRSHNLLPIEPLHENEIWISQLVGDMVSEVRAHLYSNLKEEIYCAKRSWLDIFVSADPLCNRDLDYKVKNRVANDIEKIINAYANEACLESKPVNIWAETKFNKRFGGKGRGQRVELLLFGSITKKGKTKKL